MMCVRTVSLCWGPRLEAQGVGVENARKIAVDIGAVGYHLQPTSSRWYQTAPMFTAILRVGRAWREKEYALPATPCVCIYIYIYIYKNSLSLSLCWGSRL